MHTLGIETSGQQGSVAIFHDGVVLAHSEYEQPHAHAELLLSHIETCLSDAQLSREQLDRIAVGIGPGNFTGLRVGMALAGGIAMGLHVPVYGVSSLASIAAAVHASVSGFRLVLRDARREELFCAAYDSELRSLVEPTLVPLTGFVGWFRDQAALKPGTLGCIAVGDGVSQLGQPLLESLGVVTPTDAGKMVPNARQTAAIGAAMTGEHALSAAYVRDADAKLPQLIRNSVIFPKE